MVIPSKLDETIFHRILENYKQLREEISKHSEIPFNYGTSIEVKLIHYPVSELGVGIHKDLSSNINMIFFYNIEVKQTLKLTRTKMEKIPLTILLKLVTFQL